MYSSAVLSVLATPSAPALVLRPWRAEEIEQLIEVCRDPGLRRYTSACVDTVAEGEQWVQIQERGWAAGERFSFAVHDSGKAGRWAGRQRGAQGVHRGRFRCRGRVLDRSPGAGSECGAARARGAHRLGLRHLRGPGAQRLVLRHQVDNVASCRVAQKCRFEFDQILVSAPPRFPLEGHLHVRRTDGELSRVR
ncbi:GNAT family N-acetyltransferase [Kribbella catacumbae]|uniref:GNAT family N-acetyltransferase n=1 Tax=Kribbella catacumbae TaxID=460086 RepID=UPI003B515458